MQEINTGSSAVALPLSEKAKQRVMSTEKQERQENKKVYASDAEQLAAKHLADPNHVITDEELASIRVGVTGEADEPTRQAFAESEERVADTKLDKEDETTPGAQKATPWDVLGQ